ncbi:MAG: transketolase [Selenomonadaceae bacterium]|nr:transketolase [Selenomonadaceae bacterium]
MTKPLEDILREIKLDILRMFYGSGTGHLASAFSCVEILTALYFYDYSDADRIILSKGHGVGAIYPILAYKGKIPKTELKSFYGCGSRLLALASPTVPGIEIPTGSLGQGLCFAAGLAKAYKLDKKKEHIYCVIGDGEMQEGSIWEAALFAGNHNLNNLVVILDNNKIQASCRCEDISSLEPIIDKWTSFGFECIEINGHNLSEIINALDEVSKSVSEKPKFICANTVKGHGLPYIEDKPNCHMKNPKGNEWRDVCDKFKISPKELGIL